MNMRGSAYQDQLADINRYLSSGYEIQHVFHGAPEIVIVVLAKTEPTDE